jgi:hypothetical protein
MKIQGYLDEIKHDFHNRHGFEFGFDKSQSEAHFDLTTQAAMSYLQGLLMSGKISELKDLVSQGGDAMMQSEYYQSLMQKCAESYCALKWDKEKKELLAQKALYTAFEGLREKFEAGGYEKDMKGVMAFIGLDSGMLGMLGKMGGMFGGLGKMFK